ncbi:MAG: biopolymer transporter ExbD [Confluentimicrobium sp.]|nr:biopolymer transporter ExbD [Actibacterium sp.]
MRRFRFTPDAARAPTRESTVPMINIVFLLLIFFLITAQIAPPAPFAVTPPAASSAAAENSDAPLILHLDAAGTPGFVSPDGPANGDAALAALAAARAACADCTLTLRADRAAPARTLAALLPRLTAMGFAQVDLATRAATP